jgi:hypothetical protein
MRVSRFYPLSNALLLLLLSLLLPSDALLPGATSGIFGVHGIGQWDNKTTFSSFQSKGFVPRG